jgi:DNA-binding NtrC family response regulator
MLAVPPFRVLVVDDDPKIVHVLVHALRAQRYDVLGALTARDGLRLISTCRPDLVLLDLTLPGMSGIELLRSIRSIDPNMRVIVVTGNTVPGVAREALELGAYAYVDKPFDIDYLMRVVSVALQAPST